MILGFGANEKEFEINLQNELTEFAYSQHNGDETFSDETIESLKKYAKELSDQSLADSEKYKSSKEYPDRYSYFWPYIVGDCNMIAVRIDFHHINRRHGLSPDGWAMFKNEVTFSIKPDDEE